MTPNPTRALGWTALLAGMVALTRQALRLHRALRSGRAAAQQARPFQRRLAQPLARALVLGDSTGVGVGAGQPTASFAGLLGSAHPQTEVVNLSVSGARLVDVPGQARDGLRPGERFDLVVLHIGGNDVIAGAPLARLRADAEAALDAACRLAPRVLWVGIANIGLASVFRAPLSWWVSARAARAAAVRPGRGPPRRALRGLSSRGGRRSVLTRRGTLLRPDGVHPSAASYRHCFEAVRKEAALDAWLARPARMR